MKKLIIISLSAFALALVSCKKEGVCTCKEDGVTSKVYYEDMTPAEKKLNKRTCNGDSDAKITKTEISFDGGSISSEEDEKLNQENCEWSKDGK